MSISVATKQILQHYLKPNVPQLKSGQIVRVSEKIVEGERERVQVFEGLVIAVKHGTGLDGSFTVRKMATGRVGVEKTFMLHQPSIQKIEILRQEKVRRAKLYFMRDKVNKKMKKRKTTEKNIVFDMVVQKPKDEPEETEVTPEATQQADPNPEQEIKEQQKEEKIEQDLEQGSDETQDIEEVEKEVENKPAGKDES